MSWVRLQRAIPSNPVFLSNYGVSFIHVASFYGLASVVATILKKSVDADTQDLHGWNPLLYAAMNGKIAIGRLLIEKGSDIGHKDTRGRTALLLVSEVGRNAVVKLLLENIVDGNTLIYTYLGISKYFHYVAYELIVEKIFELNAIDMALLCNVVHGMDEVLVKRLLGRDRSQHKLSQCGTILRHE